MLGCATLGMPMTLTSTMSWGGSEAGRRQQREHSLSSLHPSPRVTFVPLAWGVVFVLLLHTKTNCQRAALHVKCLSLRLMLLTQAAALDQAAGVLRHSIFMKPHPTWFHAVHCLFAFPAVFPPLFPSTCSYQSRFPFFFAIHFSPARPLLAAPGRSPAEALLSSLPCSL